MSELAAEFTVDEALKLAEKHGAWYPDVKSTSRTLAAALREAQRELEARFGVAAVGNNRGERAVSKYSHLKFGDVVINHSAGRNNPEKIGMVIGIGHRTGRLNPGHSVRLSDCKRNTWNYAGPADRLEIVGHGLITQVVP